MRRFEFLSWRTTRSRVLSVAAGALATVASLAAPSYAGVVTFGSDGNQFNMEFVTIGNPGNANDTTGVPSPAGAVGYTYDIGKFEVSADMITKFNASQSLQIFMHSTGPNKPATSISWNRAARFVNWLNTSTGNHVAYKFTTSGDNDNIDLWASGDAGYDVNNKYRNSSAKYVLPSYNEWYKAAYYDPNKTGGAGYWDYGTGSDSVPTKTSGGTLAGTAVYGTPSGPADVTNAGGLSPYGVMGMVGNAWEWDESSSDLLNSSGASKRGQNGGSWFFSNNLSSSGRFVGPDPNSWNNQVTGFRVASLNSDPPPAVPEPSMMVIGMVFGLGGLAAKRRLKK